MLTIVNTLNNVPFVIEMMVVGEVSAAPADVLLVAQLTSSHVTQTLMIC